MGVQKVAAGDGVSWLVNAVHLILKNPVPFLVMGLIVAAIGWVPLLGGLAATIFGPALLGGLMYAAREQDEGRAADIPHLFRAFTEPGKIGPMLLLCLPSLAGAVVLLFLVFAFAASALQGGGLTAVASGSAEQALSGLGGGLVVFGLLVLTIGLAVYALQFFAVPRVMLEGAEPFAAMKESIAACLADAGAVLVFLILIGVALCVLMLVLGWIPLLGWLIVGTAGYAVLGCAQYLAWRQVCAGKASAAPPANPPTIEA